MSEESGIGGSSIEEELYFEKEETVTGATKRQVKLAEAPANITIITHDDIIQSGATNIAEVFRRVPGMDVVTVTAAETEASARGFPANLVDGDRMATLIDGRTFYLEFLGGTFWSQFPFPLDDIKQIEIIKGPMSSLYGNRAMLGVINIVTYRPDETRTLLSGGGGRFEYANGNFMHAGEFVDNYWYKISGTYNRSNQFSPAKLTGSPKDWEDLSLVGEFEFIPQKETHLNLTGGITQDFSELQAGGLAGWTDRRGFIDGSAQHDFGKWGVVDFKSYWERHDIFNKDFDWDPGDLDTVDAEIRHSFSVDITPRIKNTTTYGFEYRYVDGDDPTVQALHNFAGYLQNETKFYDRVILTGGVRVDDQVDYAGINTSANGSVIFIIHPKYNLRLGIATAFNTPTTINYFSDFDLPAVPAPFSAARFVGNRNVDAENILYFDVGNTIKPIEKLKIRADFFYYRLNNMIVPTLSAIDPTTLQVSFRNDGGARAIGGELSIEGDMFDWLNGYAYWAYEDFLAINGNVDPTPNLGNPKNKAAAGLRGKWLDGRLTANLEFRYIMHHQAQNGILNFSFTPVVDVGDVYLLNARVGFWPVKNHLELAVMANNILNDNTPQVPAFDTTLGVPLAEKPQFNIWGSLRYLF